MTSTQILRTCNLPLQAWILGLLKLKYSFISIKVLISNVQNNSSLKGLTMSRKRLTDVEGKDVSENLKTNEYLERLEL